MTISYMNIEDSNVPGRKPNVGVAARAARVAAGYSLDELALTSGLTAAEIAAIESGHSTDIRHVKRIAVALQLSPTDFLG